MYIGLHVKYSLFLSDFNENLIVDKYQIQNFMKIHPLGAEIFSMRTDGKTDMSMLIAALRNFANAPEN